MNCIYCDKTFTTKSGLNLHVRTAKYCLKLRGETPSDTATYTCKDCGNISTQKGQS